MVDRSLFIEKSSFSFENNWLLYSFQLVIADKNSLNNRFIPYDIIDTEAVLILDDDVMPPTEQLTFGFR